MDQSKRSFVAHVMVRYNSALVQYENFKSVMKGATSTEIIRYSGERTLVTFVAEFDTDQDFVDLAKKLGSFYAGESKLLGWANTSGSAQHFYFAFHKNHLSHLQKLEGLVMKEGLEKIHAALRLVTPTATVSFNAWDGIVFFEQETPLRQEDLDAIQAGLKSIPSSILMVYYQ